MIVGSLGFVSGLATVVVSLVGSSGSEGLEFLKTDVEKRRALHAQRPVGCAQVVYVVEAGAVGEFMNPVIGRRKETGGKQVRSPKDGWRFDSRLNLLGEPSSPR